MSNNCQMVVFSNKAYNAIIRESFDKDPVETGGILLGHILSNGVWIVMEVLPPGIHCIFQTAYFEYDEAFVNYLAQSVANQYNIPLKLLGLWHRHPGSMDFFSTTDDGTNRTFARQNVYGVISGLVNIDPAFRFTMYHLEQEKHYSAYNRPQYNKVEIEVGDDIIPAEYFKLKYYDSTDNNLHPIPPTRTFTQPHSHSSSNPKENINSTANQVHNEELKTNNRVDINNSSLSDVATAKLAGQVLLDFLKTQKKNIAIVLLVLISFFAIKATLSRVSHIAKKDIPKEVVKSQESQQSDENKLTMESTDSTQVNFQQ